MTPKNHLNSAWSGAGAVVSSAVFYLLLPVLYFAFLSEYIPQEFDMTVADGIMERWFLAGIPIVCVAFLRKYYAYGNVRRLYAWTATTLLSMFWILYITNFGDLSGLVVYDGPDIGVTMDFAVLGLIVLTFVFKILRFVIEYCDYRDNRQEYLEENGLAPEKPENIIRVKGKYE